MQMIKKVLVVDDDLDAHELVHDMLNICLDGVKIEQAMSSENFMKKMAEASASYDLILFNVRLKHENGTDSLASFKNLYPALTDRIVLMADVPGTVGPASKKDPICIPKPFSLDYFGEVVKKVCCA
jgi:DNA-binding NtrC family response regulator